MARKVEEINAGSMADIAFLLLIFFLMATTMNVDSGLSRLLPPMPDPHQKNNDDVQVKERNVFIVLVNKYDQLLVNGQPLDVHMLREKTKEFVNNPAENPNLSERKLEEIKGLGQWPVSKGVVSLQNDRGTSYEMYMMVQNELVAAYNELRDDFAKAKFGKKFDSLTQEEQDIVKDVYPQRISEAEPKNIK
jgi:Biopolymer transport protein